MDGIFVAIVLDEEGHSCLRRTHPVALETCVTRNGTIARGWRAHSCQRTESTLFEATSGPTAKVGLMLSKRTVDRAASLGPTCIVRRGPHAGASPSA